MAHPTGQKEETRARIVENARKLFNRRGFSEVSIDEIMLAAGLTRGGFYNHFKTKDELYVEALQDFAAMRESEHRRALDEGISLAVRVLESYVSDDHRTDVENQCPLIALPSDVARAGPQVRDAYERVFRALAHVFESGVSDAEDMSAREQSLAIASACVGAMVISRTIDNAEFAEEICLAAKKYLGRINGWSASKPLQ